MYGYSEDSAVVHHIDNDPSNNDIENLIALTRKEHNEITRRNYDAFTGSLDRAVFLSITKYWSCVDDDRGDSG